MVTDRRAQQILNESGRGNSLIASWILQMQLNEQKHMNPLIDSGRNIRVVWE
jgi:hypothetical protein